MSFLRKQESIPVIASAAISLSESPPVYPAGLFFLVIPANAGIQFV
jgi:hypothetical protein